MSAQEFHIYTERGQDGWYTYVQYPKGEGGSVEMSGPFATEVEAEIKAAQALEIITRIMGERINKVSVRGEKVDG
jgi:hypothetical protein